jgi:hypothetical protein
MATIFDLIEVTAISPDTTYSEAAGNILGVVDGATSTALDDGEFDIGDAIVIGGVSYSISRIQEPSSSGRFTLGDGTNLSFDPGSESNLPVVFLTVSNGGVLRHFIIPNDSYGDMNLLEIRTGSLTDVAGSDAAIISTANNTINFVCFVAGTMIATPQVCRSVEDIRRGDLVLTRDNGPQAVRAILSRTLDLAHTPDRLRPIAFEVGSLGPGRPNRRLCVSPQHRMLVTDPSGCTVLVPAKALTGRRGVRVMHGRRQVTYFHLIFSRHEIICANGTPTESFYPGAMALQAVPDESLAELHEIFGKDPVRGTGKAPTPAAPMLRVQDARRNALTFR